MAQPDFDEARARQFAATRFGAHALRAIGAGEWSRAYAFEADGQQRVVRFGHHPQDFRKDRRAGELYAAHLPVPRVLEIGEAFDGHHYAVSEWKPGEAIETMPPARLRAALPALLDSVDALRKAPPPSDRGYGFWTASGRTFHESWRSALLEIVTGEENPRIAGWRDFLRENDEWSRLFDVAAETLNRLSAACPDARHVIHSDLTAGNVLFVDDCVSAVIDWGNSLVGDFLYDVAWLVFWSPWHPGLDADFVIEETRRRCTISGHDLHDFEQRLCAYQIHIALDSLAYNAFRHDPINLNGTLERLRPLVTD